MNNFKFTMIEHKKRNNNKLIKQRNKENSKGLNKRKKYLFIGEFNFSKIKHTKQCMKADYT